MRFHRAAGGFPPALGAIRLSVARQQSQGARASASLTMLTICATDSGTGPAVGGHIHPAWGRLRIVATGPDHTRLMDQYRLVLGKGRPSPAGGVCFQPRASVA